MKKLLLLFVLVFFKITSFASIQPVDFEDNTQLDLYNKIINNIKCVVCQAQSIVDSDTDFSRSMQALIVMQIKEKKSEQEITSYITDRYGDKVLLNPPVDTKTYLLWFMPIGICLVLAVITFKNLKKLL